MKKLFLFFCCFLCSYLYSQEIYTFNVELNDKEFAPTFKQSGSLLIYNGKDTAEKAFFENYTVVNFLQTYALYSGNLQNIFTFQTTSSDLMKDLVSKFPGKYLRTEDLTGLKIQLASYPNDYGTTSPVSNLGAPLSFKSFDYVNVPKAWDYFPGNKGSMTIGISDGKVNNSDLDLADKVSYLYETSFAPNFVCDSDSWHGTGVGAIAAAQGNNGHGIAGVCYDCDILNIPYTIDGFSPNFNGLMSMALQGVRVMNMSWIQGNNYNDLSYNSGYIPSQQAAIDQLFEMGIVLVAAAGNTSSYSAPYPHVIYCYPASYNHVISVTVVNAKNKSIYDEQTGPIPTYGMVSWSVEDLISPTGSTNYMGNGYMPFYEGTTTNTRVDICGPGYAPMYPGYLLNCYEGDGITPFLYGSATSAAAPYVTGTAALMLSLNACLNPDEVEDILQLSSKNIEANPYNSYFIGRSGSGKLETGDAVEFVYEAMNSAGNAIIEGQDFYRFNFDLQNINNKLTLSNQAFRDSNTSNFVAKNEILLTQNVDLKPNNSGYVDLKIDNNIDITCSNSNKSGNSNLKNKQIQKVLSMSKIYPNPNNGNFTLSLSNENKESISIDVFDVFGKSIYQSKTNEETMNLNLPNLNSGVYFVKLTSLSRNETLKFMKQ